MNKTFVQFSESALQSGALQMNTNLARELKQAHESFNTLAKTAAEVEAGDEDSGEAAAEQAGEEKPPQQPRNQPHPKDVAQDIGWAYSAVNSSDQHTATQPQVPAHGDPLFTDYSGRYTPQDSMSVLSRRQATVNQVFDESRPSHQHINPQDDLPFGFVDLNGQQAPYPPHNPHVYSVQVPTPHVTPPTNRLYKTPQQLMQPLPNHDILPTIRTYSHEESTFARRLMRAALEVGYQILSSSNIPPFVLNYVFKLSLPYTSVEDLRIRFGLMLSRNGNEDLDFWEAPFIHLGGAGTHYPRRDIRGNIIKKADSWTVRQIGPLERRLVRLQNVADGRWQDFHGIDLSSFEGEWFDSYDVEGYLEEHWSCKLEPRKGFVPCLVDDDTPESPTIEPSRKRARIQEPSTQPAQYDPTRRASDASTRTPTLTNQSSASSSAKSNTPPNHSFTLPEAPFGLDMNFDQPASFSKFDNIDLSFDQTLGLDLAPNFGYGFAGDSSFTTEMNMGYNLMDNLPVVKQRTKKPAWLDINKLVDGRYTDPMQNESKLTV